MSEEAVAPPAGGPDVLALLGELGVELKDGLVDPAEHVAMYSTIKKLRDQVKGHDDAMQKAQQKAALDALSGQDRALEEARLEGRAAAAAEHAEVLARTLVSAAATAAGFADPADALRYLDPKELGDEAAVAKAVGALAESKPYLLKPAPATPGLEQGPRSDVRPGADGGDWLGAAIRRKRAG